MVFEKITTLIETMNTEVLSYLGLRFETHEEYAIDYLESLIVQYCQITGLDRQAFSTGKGHRKSIHQRHYQELEEYISRLKAYAEYIEICGNARNSYAKTDRDATFMRIKKDIWETTSFCLLTIYRQLSVTNTLRLWMPNHMHPLRNALFRLWRSLKKFTGIILSIRWRMWDMVLIIIIFIVKKMVWKSI